MKIYKFLAVIYRIILNLVSISLCILFFPIYFFNKFKERSPRDTSWKFGRELIYNLGIKYWETNLKKTGCDFQNKRVLEVGSGNGQWLIALDNIGAKTIDGIEPNEAILKYSLKKITEFEKISKINVLKASAENIPHEENKFDYLLCLGVFMFTNFEESLNEFKRVLKPEGKLIFSCNGLGYLLMKIRLGVSHFKWKEVSYAINGLINTFSYWLFKQKFGYAVLNYYEAKKLLKNYDFFIEKCLLHNDINDLYGEEIFLIPTNYLIVAKFLPPEE